MHLLNWFQENLHPAVGQTFEIDKVLYEGRTAFQKVLIFENRRFGRVLVLDDIVQTTEADEFIYHEMLAHVPLVGHGAATHVLIIGGGDGGLLEEVLKHPVERVTMVEIDPEIVDLCREHLPALSGGAFEDSRTNLVIADGTKFVAETDERFDVIIVDSTDPVGPGKVLFEPPFYTACRAILKERGVLATQNGVPFYQRAELGNSAASIRSVYTHAGFFVVAVPTYAGGFMTLGWASQDTDLAAPNQGQIEQAVARLGLDTRYYNAGIHQAAFALPGYVHEATRG